MDFKKSLKWMDSLCKEVHKKHSSFNDINQYLGFEIDSDIESNYDFVYIYSIIPYEGSDEISFPLDLIDEKLSLNQNINKIDEYFLKIKNKK